MLPIPYTVVLLTAGLLIGFLLTFAADVHVNNAAHEHSRNIFVNSISTWVNMCVCPWGWGREGRIYPYLYMYDLACMCVCMYSCIYVCMCISLGWIDGWNTCGRTVINARARTHACMHAINHTQLPGGHHLRHPPHPHLRSECVAPSLPFSFASRLYSTVFHRSKHVHRQSHDPLRLTHPSILQQQK